MNWLVRWKHAANLTLGENLAPYGSVRYFPNGGAGAVLGTVGGAVVESGRKR